MASFFSQPGKRPLADCSPTLILRSLPTWEVPMGYPKPNSPDTVLPLRVSRPVAETISLTARRLTRPRSQPKPSISGSDQAALTRIAERFAPGTPGSLGAPSARSEAPPADAWAKDAAARDAAQKDQPPDGLMPQSLLFASAPGMRTLIAVL